MTISKFDVLLLTLLLALTGRADESTHAEVLLVAEVRVISEEGIRWLPARTVQEGQEIYYTVRIKNPGVAPLTAVSVVQAVPRNMTYVAGSATGAGADIALSNDGGHSFTKASAAAAVGNTAPAFTHIRWQLPYPLAPKAVVLARFRAVFQ